MDKSSRQHLFVLGISVLLLFASGCGLKHAPQNTETAGQMHAADQEEAAVPLVSIDTEFHLPIFAIHHVGPAPASASADARTWYISDKKLESILAYLDEHGFRPIFIREALAYIKRGVLPEKVVVLTFDDGPIDFYTHAWPLLKKYNTKATVNIMTGVHGENWLSADQIKELHQSGKIDIESHTRYHAYLTRVSEAEAKDELAASKAYLEELTGDPVTVIAYPFGLYDDNIISLAKDLGYQAGMTIHSGAEQSQDALFELRRFIITESTNIERILSK